MTIIAVEVKLDTRELDRIMIGLDKNCNDVLGMLAANLQLEAQSKFPPHLDTGALKSSIRFENPKENYWIVSDGVEYGIHIEFPGIKRAAWPGYPFMVPAAESTGRLLNSGALWKRLFA